MHGERHRSITSIAERPPWLVRFHRRVGAETDGEVVGAGFYVGDGRVLTCAHVVTTVLGVEETAPSSVVRDHRIRVDFPHLRGKATAEAEVVADGWFPVEADGGGDAAALRLAHVPSGAVPAPLRRPVTLDGHRFAATGYPRGSGGVNATGILRGWRGPRGRWVQLEDVKTEGVAITGGFSGAPVWDYDVTGVVGMVVSEYVNDRAKVGSMIPVGVIEEAWPRLGDWIRWRLDLDPQAATHWLPRARGVPLGEPEGWYFTGRRQLVNDLCGWLRGRPGADRAIRVVTGPPGSGKSAVLAWFVALSDPVVGPLIPRGDREWSSGPPPRTIDVAVHARDKTVDQVVAELADAAEVSAESEEQLLAALGHRRRPFTMVVDALDEARPLHSRKIARLLADLAVDHSGCGIRAVVAVRAHSTTSTGEDLVKLLGHRTVVLPMDDPRYLDPEDLPRYAYRRLVEASPPQSPYRRDPALASSVAAAVARRARPLFLVAQLTCQALMLDPDPIDTTQRGWEQNLPSDVDRAFDRYLERFGEMESTVRDLLTPLAYAEGSGLPAGQLWVDLANALTRPRVPYQLNDLSSVIRDAANYVVEDRTAVRATYRIFHQELIEYFRRGRDEEADQRTILGTLRARVPAPSGGLADWFAADAYTRAYAALHAAKSGELDDLLMEPRFLLAVDPNRLVSVLGSARTPAAVRAAGVYRRSVTLLRGRPPAESAAYLGLHAHQAGAAELAQRLTELDMPVPWSVQWVYWLGPHTYLAVGRHEGGVTAVAVGEVNGKPVGVSGGGDGSIRVWDLLTGDSIGGPINGPVTGHEGGVTAIAVGEVDGKPVAVSGGADGSIRVWDLLTGESIGLTGESIGGPGGRHAGKVTAIAVGRVRGRPIGVSGGADGSVRVWDLMTREPVDSTTAGHAGAVTAVAVAEVGGNPVVSSCSRDESRRGWVWVRNLDDGSSETLGVGLPVLAMTIGVVNGAPLLVCGTWPGSIRVWDLRSGATRTLEVGQPVFAAAVGVMEGRPILVCGSWDASVRVFDLDTGQMIGRPLRGQDSLTSVVAVSDVNSQPVAVSGSEDGTVRSWSPTTAHPVEPLPAQHVGRTTAVTTCEINRRLTLASGNDDGSIRQWDPHGMPVNTVDAGSAVFAVALCQLDGRAVTVTGSWDKTVQLWDVGTGTRLSDPMVGHTDYVAAVAVSHAADGLVAISGSGDGTLCRWSVASGSLIGEPLRGHEGGVAALATGQMAGQPVVLSGSADGVLRLWNVNSGRPLLAPLPGHADQIAAVALGEVDGRPVALSGGWDETVKLWDLASGSPVGGPLLGHSGGVAAVAVAHLDGQPVLLSGAGDETLRLWLVDGSPLSTIEVGSAIWGIAFARPRRVVVATSLGLIFIDLAGDLRTGGVRQHASGGAH